MTRFLSALPRNSKVVSREHTAGSHLPYARHVDAHTVETRDGLLLQVIHLRGLLFETADSDELDYRLLMLQGRLPLRRGATVILGAFVIFGAATTADGLLALAQAGGREYDTAQGRGVSAELPPPAIKPPVQPQAYDPYGGASVLSF